MAFHNGSNYDYHFIIKHLAEELEKQLTCLGKSTEKYIRFTVPIEKEVTIIDKNGEEIAKNISYRLHFVASTRVMASSLSSLANNLAEVIHKMKYKHEYDDKKCETCGLKYKDCNSFLDANFKDNLIEYKCLSCNKNYKKKFGENLNN